MAVSSQQSAMEQYSNEGVTQVEVIDGDDCGWEEHDSGDLADGTTRTMNEAEANPISHPNCRRVFVPVVTEPVPTEETVENDFSGSHERATDWRDGQHSDWDARLTQGQRTDVHEYGRSDYQRINDIARRDLKTLGDWDRGDRALKIAKDQMKNIDAAIAKGKLDQPMKLFRITDDEVLTRMLDSGKAVGKIFKDKGYSSTSASNSNDVGFGWGGQSRTATSMRITAPRGTNVAYPVANSSEVEVLLVRNSRFKITGVSESPSGGRIVDMELLPR